MRRDVDYIFEFKCNYGWEFLERRSILKNMLELRDQMVSIYPKMKWRIVKEFRSRKVVARGGYKRRKKS